jgi:signal transduction histidine kinase
MTLRLTGLSLRVFLYGLALLGGAALSAFLVGLFFVDRKVEHERHGGALWVGQFACERLLQPSDAPTPAGLRATLYRDDGTVVASAIDPPVVPSAERPAEEGFYRMRDAQGEPVDFVRCHDARYFVMMQPPPHPHIGTQQTLVTALLLLLLALASLPFARSLVRPLKQLVAVVERFGEGDLTARSGLARRDELGDLSRAFDAMASRLEVAVRSEKELLANVSHELRTPMSRIRVVLELAEEDPGRAQALLREISADLADLERLVNAVLEATRYDVGALSKGAALPLQAAPLDVRALLTDARASFFVANPERTLELQLPTELPQPMGDARLLRRVVDNLLENARRYSDGPITLCARVDAGQVELSVKDQGIGISAEDLKHVFTPFFRTDRSRSRATGGVGLGLALSRRIVEAHRGTIELSSVEGQGTTAVVRLPL